MNEIEQAEPAEPTRSAGTAVEITRVVAVAAVLVVVLLVHGELDATTGALLATGLGVLGPQRRPGAG